MTPAQKAQKELDEINAKKVEAQKELDATKEAKATAEGELADIDEQIEGAQDELDAEEKAKLEKEANQPSADKYEAKAKAYKQKGKNGDPIIGKGTGYEITLNKKK